MMEPGAEQGSVSVVAEAGAVYLSLICTMGVADMGRVLAERSHAEAAADAAALGAAQDLALSSGEPEVDAARFAQENGTVLIDCACAAGDADAVVTVRRTVAGLFSCPARCGLVLRARAAVDLPLARGGGGPAAYTRRMTFPGVGWKSSLRPWPTTRWGRRMRRSGCPPSVPRSRVQLLRRPPS